MTAFRLESVDAEATALPRRDDAPFVGRERELDCSRTTWERRRAERRGRHVTRRRRAGHRQVAARARSSSPRSRRATVLRRPLPAVRRGDHLLAGARGARAAAAGRARRARRRCDRELAGRRDAERVGRRDRVGVPQARRASPQPSGRSSSSSTTSSGPRSASSTWSSSRLCCRVGAPILLALHGPARAARAGARLAGGAPARAALGAGGRALIDDRLRPRDRRELRERIVRAAGGNPLFVEEMVAMLPRRRTASVGRAADDPRAAGRPPRPARPGGAHVLELAAVEGEVFHRGAVQALIADEQRRPEPR